MFNKVLLALSAASMVALPAAAEARDRSYNGGYVSNGYYGGGYNQGYYGNGYNQGYDGGYNQGYYGDRYYGRRDRCGNGTAGLIVGGAAGALLGREVTRSRSHNRYSYRRGGSGTTGAIIGGALGALIGREVARSC